MRFVLPFLLTIFAMPALFISLSARTEAAQSTQQTPASAFIQDIGNRAIAVMANKDIATEQRTQQYRAILHDSFDLQTIGRFVLGRSWATANDQQKSEFMSLFEKMVLETYGDRLNFYSGEGFQIKGARSESDKDSIVSTEVTHPDGSTPTAIDWRVRDQGGGKLAVIDVVIEGVSQSVTQRQEFASIIQRNNGNIDGLLNAMRQRTQK